MGIIIARLALAFLLLYIIIAEVCINQSALALFFGHSIALSPYASSSFSPQIAVSGSNVYVVWSSTNITSNPSSSSAGSPKSDIYFKKSTDYGSTFDDTVSLSSGNTGVSGSPKIAVSGSNVYVVWIGNSAENSAIYFKKSTDYGSTFDDTVSLSSGNTGVSGSPKIAVSGSNVYVVWSSTNITSIPSSSSASRDRGDIYFKKSTDYGYTFDAKTNLSKNPGNSFSPQIAVSGSNVYVVWTSNSSTNSIGSSNSHSQDDIAIASRANIYFKKSTDYGSTFDDTVSLSSGNTGVSGSPKIAVSGSNVYVVWIGVGSSGGDGDGGITSNKTKNNRSAGNDTINENDCCESGIYFRRSTDNGTTFATDINLDKNGRSKSPQIAVSGSNVYLVWVNNDSYTEPQISFRYSTDYGSIFSGIVVDLSHSASNAKSPHSPQIAVSGSNVYVVWTSNSSTTSNSNYVKNNIIFAGSDIGSVIYFKRIGELFFTRNT
jgi:hypothetical protein